jgi:hypothetical protein
MATNIYDMTDTWTAAGTTYYAIKMNVTNTASAAASALLDLQIAGVSKFKVDKNGVASLAVLRRSAPVTVTASYTVTDTDSYIISNRGASNTITLPAAASHLGREITIKTIQAFTVISASANVCPRTDAAAGTAILAATDGAWAKLVSDGTNWIIMQAA